jgi:hypothetical protein
MVKLFETPQDMTQPVDLLAESAQRVADYIAEPTAPAPAAQDNWGTETPITQYATPQAPAAEEPAKVDRGQLKAERDAARKANADKWLDWQERCRWRKAHIAEKQALWKRAIAERDAELVALDERVEAARKSYQDAKLSPVPPYPV